MSQSLNSAIAVIGIDIGKNTFHVIGSALIDDWTTKPTVHHVLDLPLVLRL